MRVLWLILISIIPFAAKAQTENKPTYFSKHIASAEFGGMGIYSVNYENIINPDNIVKFTVGAGGAYFPGKDEEKFRHWKVKGTMLLGKAPFYVGAGLNFLHETHWYRYIHHNYDYGIIAEDDPYLIPFLQLRYQPAKNGLFVSYTLYFDEYENNSAIGFSIKDQGLFWMPSLNIGYTFNSHRK